MRKKILTMVCLIAAAFSLGACSQKSDTQNRDKTSTKTVQRNPPAKLTAQNITATQKAAAITIYAAKKYKGPWQRAYRQAAENTLSVSVKSSTGFSRIFKKQDYIYEVSGNGKENDAFYGLDGAEVVFFNHEKKLGSISLNKILTYLNKQQEAKKVKKLAVDLGAAITSVKYGVKGDKGLAFVPQKLQGTWYSKKGKKLVITEHAVNGEEIHRIASSGLTTANFAQTKKWARARIENINGVDCYHVQSLDAQDFGLLYTVQKEGKNIAVVTYSVDTGNSLNSYWKTTKIAKDNVQAQFKSLK